MNPGDRVAVLGFTSVDYAVIDTTLALAGAVSVPLQTSAPEATLRPIVAETEPVVFAASVDHLADAVDLVRDAESVGRLIVFDHRAEVDDHRDAVADACARLADAGRSVEVVTLAEVLAHGATLPAAQPFTSPEKDPLLLLIYTSGSTGAPKGAMYPERLVANAWRRSGRSTWGGEQSTPSITLNFMPMSHMMGRGLLYGTLGAGGTAYFAARSDLSTFLEDLALVRPTQLTFVPRIWDTIAAEVAKK